MNKLSCCKDTLRKLSCFHNCIVKPFPETNSFLACIGTTHLSPYIARIVDAMALMFCIWLCCCWSILLHAVLILQKYFSTVGMYTEQSPAHYVSPFQMGNGFSHFPGINVTIQVIRSVRPTVLTFSRGRLHIPEFTPDRDPLQICASCISYPTYRMHVQVIHQIPPLRYILTLIEKQVSDPWHTRTLCLSHPVAVPTTTCCCLFMCQEKCRWEILSDVLGKPPSFLPIENRSATFRRMRRAREWPTLHLSPPLHMWNRHEMHGATAVYTTQCAQHWCYKIHVSW